LKKTNSGESDHSTNNSSISSKNEKNKW